MNLQQHNSSTSDTAAAPTQTEWTHDPPAATQMPPPSTRQRYEPSEVERIIARASALQETHQKTLSPQQIEAIAAEVGIAPEFVHLAMKQEENAAWTEREETEPEGEPHLWSRLAFIVAFTLFSTFLVAQLESNLRYQWTPYIAFIGPAIVAFGQGVWGRSRRWSASLGALVAVGIISAFLLTARAHGGGYVGTAELSIFALMMGVGALLGATGAQARRIVSRRVVKSRVRRRVVGRSAAEV